MRYFIDTEFDQEDLNKEVQLISMAIVGLDGRELYIINRDYDWTTSSQWLYKNVRPVLVLPGEPEPVYRDYKSIRGVVEEFLRDGETPEFWGYYADYDWYLFTRLWGFMKMPAKYPMLCMDVKQFAIHLGVRKLPDILHPEHNALVDARWTKKVFEYLTGIPGPKVG